MKTLAGFLRTHREKIIAEWMRRSGEMASARGLPRADRRDHIPQLLDAMADAIERGDRTSVSLEQLPLTHADERRAQDFDLREVVTEYRLLRRVILDEYGAVAPDLSEQSRRRMPPLVTLNENLDHAITDAVDHFTLQRDRTRDFFVGVLSHDLRDPLSVISMSTQLLLSDPVGLTETQQRSLHRVRTATQRMEDLIADLLDVTRTRFGSGLPVKRVQADLRPIVADTVDQLASANPAREIRCRARDTADLGQGHWDPLRIGQAVSNLVANALKHGADPIVVELSGQDDSITLQVSNAGEIPAAVRAHLFEPFQTRDEAEGIGLGLYIVNQIAIAHGGSLVLLENHPGETRFRLRLPRDPPATTEA